MNRLLPKIERHMTEANLRPVIVSYPAPAVGGAVMHIDLLNNLFVDHSKRRISPSLLFDYLDRAIGVYEDLEASGETLGSRSLRDGIGIIGALQNKLRPMLRAVPEKEKEVQDAVESLLRILDVEFSREAEAFSYFSKSYKPDFVLGSGTTALELKLCKDDREKGLIAEINDDIVAYSTRYANLVFLIYDVGSIRDEQRFRGDIEHRNVLVVIVKH